MRPISITVQAFRGWRREVEIPLDRPVTLLVGENRAGKSSTTNAVEWCLYGAVVEKSGSGIAERSDWEVHPRDGGSLPTQVRLALGTDAGQVEILRRRDIGAGARSPDVFEVRLEDGRTLAGADAAVWLEAAPLPDWETYRRAHCFHQEAARGRVITLADRSAVLTSLLGLDEDARVRQVLQALTRRSLVAEIDSTLDDLERSVNERLARPRRALVEAERALAARGVSRGALGAALVAEVRKRLVERAGDLSARLEIDAGLPDAEAADAVRAWARTWGQTARREAPALGRLQPLRDTRQALARALAQAGPAREVWTTARDQVRQAVVTAGDAAAREKTLTDARQAEVKAQEALRHANAMAALLRDARKVVDDTVAAPSCPVCTTPIEGLGQRIDAALLEHGTEEVAELSRACDAARRAREDAERGVEAYSVLRNAEQRAEDAHQTARSLLGTQLDLDASDDDIDLVAAARTRLEEIDADGKALAALDAERDKALTLHADDTDLLRDLERWEQCSARAEQVVDLDALDTADALDAAVDEAAAFTADLEAFGAIARVAQEERSTRREAEVNRTLGGYFALLTSEADVEAVRVKAHRTTKKLTYRLLDASGRSAAPVLNQAALNALSLAMLFAQAEEEARSGRLAWVVLDDPVQSLDDERQEGLARAIERLSTRCSVLVATTPSHFVDRVRDFVSVPRRILGLGAWDPARGSSLERTEEP